LTILAMAGEEEQPRLYSKGFSDRVPVDVIAPKHFVVHSQLVRWGTWSWSRGRGSSLASAESLYSGKGGTPPSTAPMAADPQIMAVERALIRMPMQHADTLRMLYAQRLTPGSICKALHLRYEGWGSWIFMARCMVVNLLRREVSQISDI